MMSVSNRVIFVILLLTAVIVGLFYSEIEQNKKYSRLSGTLQRIEGNNLVVFGIYDADTGRKDMEIIRVKVDDGTRIEKTSFTIPQNGGAFEVDKLPKDIKHVDLSVLRKDYQNVAIGVEIDLKTDLQLFSERIAREIRYKAPGY